VTVTATPAATPSQASGILLIIIAATGFGLLPVLTRAADALGLPIEIMLALRFVGPALVFLPWLLASLADRSTATRLFIAGFFMGLGAFGYLNALVALDVATAALIFFTFPVFAILFGYLFAGTRPTRREALAVGLIIAATALILQPRSADGTGTPTTVLAAFAAPLAYGFLLFTLSRTGHGMSVKMRSAPVAFGSLIGAMPVLFLTEAPLAVPLSGTVPLLLLAQVILAGIVPQIALVAGTARTGPTLAAIVATSELVVALSSGWTVLGEPVHLAAVIGAAMILSAIVLAATARP